MTPESQSQPGGQRQKSLDSIVNGPATLKVAECIYGDDVATHLDVRDKTHIQTGTVSSHVSRDKSRPQY